MNEQGNYQGHRNNVDGEVFRLISPEYASGSRSISLILSGSTNSTNSGETGFDLNRDYIQNESYVLWGVGIEHQGVVDYRETLQNCSEVWIPILDPSGSVHELRFEVGFRTSYSGSTYLWNTGSSVIVSGSWIVDGIHIAEQDPFAEYDNNHQELDYTCILPGADQSVIFVDYIPKNFEYNGTYNALLNNANTAHQVRFFHSSGSARVKNFVVDDHKNPALGGLDTGEVAVSGGWSRRIDQRINYLASFSASAATAKYSSTETGSLILQTLDLAFLNFRAVSASVYVDRERAEVIQRIEDVWSNMQENNTDDSEVVYFAPLCELVKDWESGDGWAGDPAARIPDPEDRYPNPNWVFGEIQQVGARTTIPSLGNILFKMNGHTPVRHVRATVFVPFINTVYRTDDYGIVREAYSGSIEIEE